MANKALPKFFTLLLLMEARIFKTVLGDSIPNNETTEGSADVGDIDDSIFLGRFNTTTDLRAPDLEQFLKAMEFNEKDRESIRDSSVYTLTVQKKMDSPMPYLLSTRANHRLSYVYFIPGKEFVSRLSDQRVYTGTITFQGNKLIKKETHPNFTCQHVGVFAPEGVKVTLECNGVKAMVEFKRLPSRKE